MSDFIVAPLPAGYRRQWMQCKRCGRVAYYDYVPYSFSRPVMALPCGHGSTERGLGAVEISAEEALEALKRR